MASIVWLSKFFCQLCVKVIDPSTEAQLMTGVGEVLVLL
jgi:hypothetical protein